MMALTDEQIKLRRNLVGGSDTNIIMGGNAEKILHLWKVKRGEEESEDLSDVLPVQMGTFTEPFNCQWFEKNTGKKVTAQGDSRLSLEYPFMGCTLDGLTDDGQTVVEFKHVSAFAKEDEILDRYMPQLHHNMIVCGLERAVLSVFYGNHKWDKYEVRRDPMYAAIVVGAVADFWDCVQTGRPPVAIKSSTPVTPIRRVDMTGNNQWASLAQQYRDNVAAHKLHDEAVKGMKSMIEEDVMEASGYGINMKRDKRGALRLKGE
jgi:predicted phage-related endonuclease